MIMLKEQINTMFWIRFIRDKNNGKGKIFIFVLLLLLLEFLNLGQLVGVQPLDDLIAFVGTC